jgi:hypothetical protein
MTFIEGEFFQDKRRNLPVYKRFLVDFFSTELYWYLLKKSLFTIREQTWPVMKRSLLILLAPSGDDIYWMSALPQ